MIKRFHSPPIGVAARDTNFTPDAMVHRARRSTDMHSPQIKRPGSGSRYLGRALVAVFTIAVLIGGWYFYPARSHGPAPVATDPSAAGYISNDQLEAQYGIRITLIAVTAMGGIVDFRYKVVDRQKAAGLLQDSANAPVLTAVDSGLSLSPTYMGKHHGHMRMKRGAVPFTFYPNVRGAVKPGTPVSAAFGKIQVEPIAAQ